MKGAKNEEKEEAVTFKREEKTYYLALLKQHWILGLIHKWRQAGSCFFNKSFYSFVTK